MFSSSGLSFRNNNQLVKLFNCSRHFLLKLNCIQFQSFLFWTIFFGFDSLTDWYCLFRSCNFEFMKFFYIRTAFGLNQRSPNFLVLQTTCRFFLFSAFLILIFLQIQLQMCFWSLHRVTHFDGVYYRVKNWKIKNMLTFKVIHLFQNDIKCKSSNTFT